ncbi:hypothetical protein CCHL11_06359 [Colletotrichum chlorophyti]|uniref:Siderophore biosynthesis enzyme n=1 Tax=Colletotrichum chlorophyti TaxID=708187 RepID=A0A1Q8RPX4_9PEZI|nr:hypothetical protein CCHL11_06359 [Colletotrichum chlorophyti]
MSISLLTSVAVLAATVLAKTDLTGCTSSDSVVTPSNGGTPYATRIYYVPGTGEICAALDCGGGRAPPKTTVPGCPLYEGTETYSPSFLPSKTSAPIVAATTEASVTTPAPATTKSATESTAASEKSESEASESAKGETQTGSQSAETITTSAVFISTAPAPGNHNATFTTSTASRSGTQASRSGAAGSAATSGATNVPNAAAPNGVSMFGLVAGVAMGAVLL